MECRVKNVSFTPKTLFLGYFGHLSSADAPTSSADTIAQNVQWSSNTPTTFAVFSATGVLVKTFVAIPQSAEDSFKALQVPHGTYYLKDLKSNYIKKVVK